MKATAIMKSGLASSPAYSDAVFEIDITVSIMANANRGETLPFLSMVIPDWMALMWNAINSLMMEGAEFHEENPTTSTTRPSPTRRRSWKEKPGKNPSYKSQ